MKLKTRQKEFPLLTNIAVHLFKTDFMRFFRCSLCHTFCYSSTCLTLRDVTRHWLASLLFIKEDDVIFDVAVVCCSGGILQYFNSLH